MSFSALLCRSPRPFKSLTLSLSNHRVFNERQNETLFTDARVAEPERVGATRRSTLHVRYLSCSCAVRLCVRAVQHALCRLFHIVRIRDSRYIATGANNPGPQPILVARQETTNSQLVSHSYAQVCDACYCTLRYLLYDVVSRS